MSTTKKFEFTRKVTQEECSWLDRDYEIGEIVYECLFNTYGCISPYGIAATESTEGDYPFFEIPYNALKEII
jgi:hypothetical protein